MSIGPAELEPQSQDLRQRLALRIVIALGLLIAALIGYTALQSPREQAPDGAAGLPTRGDSGASAGASTTSPAQATVAASGTPDPAPPPVEPAGSPAAPAVSSSEAPGAAAAGSTPAPATGKPSDKTKLVRGPHLQVGVFMQASNAEELKATLEAQGLPVYIESRVQIGPFKDRKEAERMRDALRAKGVTTLLIAQ